FMSASVSPSHAGRGMGEGIVASSKTRILFSPRFAYRQDKKKERRLFFPLGPLPSPLPMGEGTLSSSEFLHSPLPYIRSGDTICHISGVADSNLTPCLNSLRKLLQQRKKVFNAS